MGSNANPAGPQGSSGLDCWRPQPLVLDSCSQVMIGGEFIKCRIAVEIACASLFLEETSLDVLVVVAS